MKKIITPLLFGFTSAYSLTAVFHPALRPEHFGELRDYYTAGIYELLGEYSFSFVILFVLLTGLYVLLQNKGLSYSGLFPSGRAKALYLLCLSVLFGFFYSLGKCFIQAGYDAFPGSVFNILKFVLCTAGFACFSCPLLAILSGQIQSLKAEGSPGFFEKNGFVKAFLILILCYLPFLILSFPGNLCYDVIGQIEQVLNASYSTHHPLIHTLWVGGLVRLGEVLFSSAEIGLFLYMVTQILLLLAAFAASIGYLAKRNVKSVFLWGMLALYILTPLYTNLATTAIKDIPFTAFVLLYYILYCDMVTNPSDAFSSRYHLPFVLLQVGVIVTRNNGLPLVILSGIGGIVYLALKKKTLRTLFHHIGLFFLESLFLSQILLLLLSNGLGAAKGSAGEIFSLPFQQTAYYLKESGQMTSDELASVEAILGDPAGLAESYNPDLADPVKAHFRKDSSFPELVSFGKTYVINGLKHPFIYTKAFLIHTYGWFCPSVPNETRYETDYDAIRQSLLSPDAGKFLIFFYRFAGRFAPLGVLENIGAWVWLLALLTVTLLLNKRGKEALLLLPLWICHLVCLASPCFFGHARYALPIIACLPFALLFLSLTKPKTAETENRPEART